MGKGGGGGGAPTQQTAYQTNVPEYAKPYVTNMLEATQNQLFNMDGGGISGFKPYQPYSSDVNNYVAGFSPMQQQAQRGIAGLQMPGQFNDASNMAQQAGLASLNAQYNPMSARYNQVRGAQTQAAQMGNAPMSQAATGSGQDMQAATGSAQDMQAAQMGGSPQAQAAAMQAAQMGNSPQSQAAAMQAAQMGNSPQAQAAAMQAAQLGNTPLAQAAQFGGPRDVNAQNVGTQDYTGQNVSNYMNPYLKGALDPQLAEVQRQYDITGAQQQSGATKSGAFGGSREALMAAENQRNAGLAKNQIIGQGYNQAFNNAQQQFNAQQQASLQAQQANQGANLQAGISNQNMGYNTGLQNAQLQQQANLANQGLMGQYGLQQGQFGQAANQANQQAQMQANLANQSLAGQYGLQQGQFGQAANQANQQAQQQTNLANQALAGQYGMQQGQFGQAANQFNAGNQQQANLANQAMAGQYGMQQGQFNQAANQANQAARNQFGLSNLANQQTANQANQAAQNQFGMANLSNRQQSGLANQALMGQYGMQQGQFNQAANLANQQSRNQANLANQQAQLQAQQQNIGQQQFGANYRMQGLGQAGQMAGQLAGIGGQQLQAQQGIYGMQNQIGAQQQAQEQAKINQAIQDYATQQQYPMMQLGLMSNMLRGLPMQATNVQSYQAQAPVAQQAAGLLGAYNAYSGGRKAGGVIKDYKKGGVTRGIPGYKSGVLVGLEDDIGDISQMDSYAPPMQRQLPKLAQQTASPGLKQMIGAQQAEDAMGQQMAGVAAAPTGGLGMNMAEGGIVPRFAGEDTSLVTEPISGVAYPYTTPEEYMTRKQNLADTRLKDIEERLSPEEKAFRERTAERLSGLDLKKNKAERMNAALAFLEAGSTVGGLGTAAIAGSKKYMLGQADIEKNYTDMQDNLMKSAAEQKVALRKDAAGDAAGALAASEKAAEFSQKAKKDQNDADFAEKRLKSEEAMAEARNRASIRAAEIGATIKPTEAERLRKDVDAANKADPTGQKAAEIIRVAELVNKTLSQKDESITGQALKAAAIEYNKFVNDLAYNPTTAVLAQQAAKGDPAAIAKIEDIKKRKEIEIYRSYQATPNATASAPPPPNKGKVDSNNPLLGGKS